MMISREYAISELDGVARSLKNWARELKAPMAITEDGSVVPAYGDEGPPEGLSVSELRCIASEQLKAELAALAGRLEALAVT